MFRSEGTKCLSKVIQGKAMKKQMKNFDMKWTLLNIKRIPDKYHKSVGKTDIKVTKKM